MKYLKFEFATEEQALNFVAAMEGIAYATIPKILLIEVNEEGEVLSSTQWIVDVIGLDWQIPEGFEIYKVTPEHPIHMIAGMEHYYNPEI